MTKARTPRSGLIPVLMMVPYFAPQSHAAMFRAHKLAKYLPEYGFKPIVVTTDTNYLYNEDNALLAELPPEVEIHRARYVEPTLRGIRMALGGPDRSFAALKAAGKIAFASSEAAGDANPGRWLAGAGSLVARLIGDWPDRYWTWTGPAAAMAQRLIRERDIRLLYTSANPVSFLRAAIRIKQRNDLVWLFDSRDPLGYGQKHTANGPIGTALERKVLQKSLTKADHVSGLAAAYGQIFFDLYGLEEKRWSFIPSGLDKDYLSRDNAVVRGKNLLHIGEVMTNQSPYCFQTLEMILMRTEKDAPFDRMVFVGRREVNEPIIRRMTADLPRLAARLTFLDHRPQTEVYELIREARACLLVPGATRYWWTNFAKLVDYMGLAVPVIAHVPPISEARHELDKAGIAFFLGDDIGQDAEALAAWLVAEPPAANAAYCTRYTARGQVADFATLFDKLLAQNRNASL